MKKQIESEMTLKIQHSHPELIFALPKSDDIFRILPKGKKNLLIFMDTVRDVYEAGFKNGEAYQKALTEKRASTKK